MGNLKPLQTAVETQEPRIAGQSISLEDGAKKTVCEMLLPFEVNDDKGGLLATLFVSGDTGGVCLRFTNAGKFPTVTGSTRRWRIIMSIVTSGVMAKYLAKVGPEADKRAAAHYGASRKGGKVQSISLD